LLVAVTAARLSGDPNPNPVGFGMLAGLTFWPGVIMIVIGFCAREAAEPLRCAHLQRREFKALTLFQGE
jgi:hypothetical protein